MTRMILVLAAAILWSPSVGLAAHCAPLDLGTEACQEAIGKAGAVYQKKHMSAVNSCLTKFHKGSITGPDAQTVCRGTSLSSLPTDASTAEKLTKAVTAATTKYSLKCNDAQVASLQLCANTVLGLQGCLFDQHFPVVDAGLAEQYGTLTPSPDVLLQKCQTKIAKESAKYMNVRMKAVQKCFKERNKVCGTADPMPHCLTAQATGPKSEQKVVEALAKAKAKFEEKVALLCSDAQIAQLDACGATNAGLSACITCTHGNGAETQLAHQYRAVRIADTTTGLQPVADTTEDGDTLLIEPGTYNTPMELKSDGLSVLGHKNCVTGDRPLIDNPGGFAIGIISCGSRTLCANTADDQVIQSLEVNNWDDYCVYTVGAEGVTYRDLVNRGPEVAGGTEYGPFPILSNNVLIEDCFVSGISDAGIYVGQSSNIVVRNNEVTTSVAGIEIENSANAEVYGNFTHGNTAGILIFKLPGLPVQYSNCHNVHDNITTGNNHPNYGVGFLELVPQGTGMLFLSNDTGWFHNNTISNNDTLGFAATDQIIINALNDPDPFSPPSPDPIAINNYMVNNAFSSNGNNPDPAFAGFESDTLAVFSGGSGNCANGNTGVVKDVGMGGLPACPGGGVAQPPGCPNAPISTTTTSTSTTVLVSTTSTTLLPTFTNVYNSILTPKCVNQGCHTSVNTYAGLNLDTPGGAYSSLVNVNSSQLPSMKRVLPSDPTLSYLQHKVDGTQAGVGGFGSQMPLTGGPLSIAERDLIRDWILAGAAND